MDRNYKFERGQKVKMLDEEGISTVRGEVTDTTTHSTFIKWENLSEPQEHFTHEYEKIKLEKCVKKKNGCSRVQ